MAYGRRKAWENYMLAVSIVGLQGGIYRGEHSGGERRGGHRWVSADLLLAEMGVRLQ